MNGIDVLCVEIKGHVTKGAASAFRPGQHGCHFWSVRIMARKVQQTLRERHSNPLVALEVSNLLARRQQW